MSDQTDEKSTEPEALIEPPEPTSAEPTGAEPTSAEPTDAESSDAAAPLDGAGEPVTDTDGLPDETPLATTEHDTVGEPVIPTADPGAAVLADAAAPSAQPAPVPAPNPHVLYVEAPQHPRAKGNRAFGALIALLSSVAFAILYAVTLLIVEFIRIGSADVTFISTVDFWVPVVAFAVGFILLVIIVNRAGWAAHVLGSLFVAVFVYFATGAALLVIHAHEIVASQAGVAFQNLLFSTGAIAAALLAREVSLWVGFGIAARGRRVKARNHEAREAYDRDFSEKRAEYERQSRGERDSVSTTP